MRRRRFVDWTVVVAALLILLLMVLVLLPLEKVIETSVTGDTGQFSLEHYRQILADAAFVKPMVTTLWTSAAVGAICVLVGAPMAWLVTRTDLPCKRVLRMSILASFVTPPFVGAFAWVLLGGPNAGLINQWYYAIRGVKPFEAEPIVNIFSAGGMVFVMALYTFPFAFTFIANGLDAIPCELEEASAIHGASVWRTAWEVTLPLVTPALLAGFLITFLQSMTLFGTPAILALPAGIETMTTKIWSLFQFPPQTGLAAAASLPLLLVTVVLLRVQTAIMGRRSYAVIGGKASGVQEIRLGAWTVPALMLFAFVLGSSIVLPYAVLIRTAFVRNWSAPVAGNVSLEHWRFVLFEFSQTKPALENTFVLGIAAATVGTVLVATVGYLSVRRLVWGYRVLAFLSTTPVAVPGIVLAVGLFLSYTRAPFLLYGTLSIIFLAYLTKELPVGYQQITASLKAVQSELEDAGRIFGATRMRTLLDITGPLMRNDLITAWIFIFIGSIRELSATIILFTAQTKTISVTMFDLRESGDWGPISVLAIIMLLVTFAMIALVEHFNVRSRR